NEEELLNTKFQYFIYFLIHYYHRSIRNFIQIRQPVNSWIRHGEIK
ncbi:hypothetical protein SNEBB_007430, partial [Seison nebaliae]